MVTLLQMENTVRRMSARYTQQSMPTSQIDYYINLAYTIHFPEQFKTLKLTKPYVFYTIPNVDTYAFPYESGISTTQGGQPAAGNFQIGPPVFCQGYQLRYFQDKSTFYNVWPKLSVNQQIGTGTGIVSTYMGTITGFPFLRAQLDIFGNVTEAAVVISASVTPNSGDTSNNTYIITDVPLDNNDIGNLVDLQGNVVGAVNYLTGQYSFKPFNNTVIPSTETIYASVVPYGPARPVDVLFNNQQLIFRPVPLQVYQVEFQISQQPTALLAETDSPELDEWYLLICALATKLIYTDFPDPEGMAYLQPILQEQIQHAQRRTLRQMTSQRARTIFSQPGRPYAGFFYGNEYGGGM